MKCNHCETGRWRFRALRDGLEYWVCSDCEQGSLLLHCHQCEQLGVRSLDPGNDSWACYRCRQPLSRCTLCRRIGLSFEPDGEPCPHCHC